MSRTAYCVAELVKERVTRKSGQDRNFHLAFAVQVTRERIRQIENKALAKLKDPMRHTSLKPYSDGEAMSLTSSIGWRQGINRNSSQ